MSTDSLSLAKLQEVIDSLLGPDGCPWDRKQTPLSLCDYVIEEAFELVSAIRAGDVAETAEELGDVLFLLLFQATLHARAGQFTLADVVDANAAKMIRRHPHVFGDTVLANQDELLRNWERIKRGEKAAGDRPPGAFASLPKGLPPLLKAYRVHSKAARLGFTWATDEDARAQFDAEWREYEEACQGGSPERMEEEFGDALFTLVELGRRRGIKANAALDRANLKFLARYERMESLARERGLELLDMPMADKDRLWAEVKAGG
ncbi:MAG: nucleoside triphosphate pyrophosphohydrolase [Proteobacteria bacterium]|nr:nucleoside triphosphate pyrophosphohydrolase [Pseudomonadota bacterium]MBU1596671.1 nucleoside triphosphate pyrophosphohydrolase [Pseudomonadota bacterium]